MNMNTTHEAARIAMTDAEGALAGELTFTRQPDGAVSIDHTIVSPHMQGQGIAGALVKAAAERFRQEGCKIVPVCSYAVKWFDQHVDERDVLAK